MPKVYTDKQIQDAKQMYMDFVPPTKIVREIGIGKDMLYKYIRDKWREERDYTLAEAMAEKVVKKKSDFLSLGDSTVTVMRRALEHLANRNEPPSVKEAKVAAEIYHMVDTISKLDANRPTEIIANEKPITVIELKDKLKADPFFQEEIENAEIKEIDEQNDTNSKS